MKNCDAAGLTTTGACGDITRNVCGCPVAGVDPNELYDTRQIVQDVTNYFLNNKDFSDLPRKYKISISGCPIHCNQPEINDVGIQAVKRVRDGKEEIGFHVRVGGGLSTQPYFAQQLDIYVKPEQVLDVCRGVTEIFRDDGYRKRRNHTRLKFLVADWGAEKFREDLIQRLGWTPEPAETVAEPVGTVQQDHLGIHPQKQAGKFWIGVSVITGRLTTEQMFAAADIADRYCEGNLRTTNQQNYLFPHIDASQSGSGESRNCAMRAFTGTFGVPSGRGLLHGQRVLQSGDYGNQSPPARNRLTSGKRIAVERADSHPSQRLPQLLRPASHRRHRLAGVSGALERRHAGGSVRCVFGRAAGRGRQVRAAHFAQSARRQSEVRAGKPAARIQSAAVRRKKTSGSG